jgi:hypothetical protein
MRCYAAIACAAVLAAAPASAYNVTISNDPTSGGSIAGGIFKATAPDAVLNYVDLQNALATGNLKVQTSAHGTQAGDIIVAHKFAWSANTLTLDAYHSILVNKRLLPTATAGLGFVTNDGGSGGDLYFGNGINGSVIFDSTAQSLTINTVPYTLEDHVSRMAADMNANPSGNYALAHSETETISFGNTPVTGTFTGNLEGLGNHITNLTVVDSTDASLAGLFYSVGTLAKVKNLTLTNVSVHEYVHNTMRVAGLAIYNSGLISNVSVSGTVGGGYNVQTYIGGLVVDNSANGKIVDSSSSAAISTIGAATIGGLAEQNEGNITFSGATGDISGGDISTAGGLVGLNTGTVTFSYAKGAVAAEGGTLGGLIGNNDGTIDQSYAMGNLDSSGGTATDGGFVGFNSGSISNAYAKGDIVGQNGSTMGGFVGNANIVSNIATSYSTGTPAGGTTIGGFAGFNNATATSTWLYWNTTTSGISQATGNGNDTGITGLTSNQMRAALPTGFDSAIWTEVTGVNYGLPYLIALPVN